jgi:hypothetical protein
MWGAGVGSRAGVGYQDPDLVPVRKEWEDLKAQIFEPAKWFRTSSSRLDHTQTREAPRADPQLVSSLAGTCRQISTLIREGRRESEQMGEITGDYQGAQERKLIKDWRAWTRDWRARVDLLGARLPDRPSMDSPLDLQMAYQKLGDALHQSRIVVHTTNDYGVPFLYERKSRFDAAERALSEAQDMLDKLR